MRRFLFSYCCYLVGLCINAANASIPFLLTDHQSVAVAANNACSEVDKRSCPPGLFCEEGRCECGDNYPMNIIVCNGTDSFAVKYYCATFDMNTNTTVTGSCFTSVNWSVSGHYPGDTLYTKLPRNVNMLTKIMCNPMNRTGTLCGRCLPEHYPLAYSYNLTCVRCPNIQWNLAKYIMAAYLPLTLFCLVILFFKINTTSSHLFPLVFYCQQLSQPHIMRIIFSVIANKINSNLYFLSRVLTSFYAIWNLDFFRPFYSDFCLGIGILPTLALDYAIAVYPLLLVVISYLLIVLYDRNYRVVTIIWRPFQVIFSLFRRNWDIRTSVIDAFASFLFLSNTKFLSTSFDFLIPTRVYSLYPHHSNSTIHLYYSEDIGYFSNEHLPYAILALIVLCLFIILPIGLLILYPFQHTQRILNKLPVNWHFLHIFMDSFQGCYKNGTQPGTRDYRWFAAVHFIVRLSVFLLYSLTDKITSLTMSTVILVLHITSVAAFKPFKTSVVDYNCVNVVLLLFLTLFAISAIGLSFSLLTSPHLIAFFSIFGIIIYGIPLLYTIGVSSYWVYVHRRFGLNIIYRLRSWRRGYSELPDQNDDPVPDRIENSIKYPRENLANFSS